MLKILALNYEYPPIGGGGGNAHKHLLNEMTQFDDVLITLITSTNKPEPYTETLGRNIQAHFLPIPKKDLFYWRRSEIIRYLLINYGFLHNYLKKVPFDLCHVFFGFPTGLLAYLFRHRVPYIVSVRGSDVPGYNTRFSLDYYFLNPILKKIYNNSEEVIANSQGLKHLFESHFPKLTASVIPNGIDTRMFLPMANKPAEPFSIVTVARLIPRKGIDVLIRACALLHNTNIPFLCHIIGDGPEADSLKKITQEEGIADQVIFHGQMETWQVSMLLPKCHLFVLPSYAEGMPNAALEAMACGLPLILTDTGGSDELISGNGEIVPMGQEMPLFSTIHSLIVQPDRLQEMSRQSRILAEQMSWTRIARQYYDLYRTIIPEIQGL